MATVEKSMDTDHADDIVLYDDGLTHEDALSLFSTSLNKALERQKETIVSAISEKFTKDSAGTVSHVIEPVAFSLRALFERVISKKPYLPLANRNPRFNKEIRY